MRKAGHLISENLMSPRFLHDYDPMRALARWVDKVDGDKPTWEIRPVDFKTCLCKLRWLNEDYTPAKVFEVQKVGYSIQEAVYCALEEYEGWVKTGKKPLDAGPMPDVG